jgi:short-subunit dehydrogenase
MTLRPLALVTGASSGLGLTFARQLASRGHDLALVARDAKRLDATASGLAAGAGVNTKAIVADLSRREGMDAVIEYLTANPVDVLVNGAGFGTRGALATTDPDAQERMLQLHVVAVHRLTLAALNGMLARKRGAIITISSVASFIASGGNANYCATKAYQRHYMESLAVELQGTGVYAQALCPGFTRTEFHERGNMKMSHVPAMIWQDAEVVVRESLVAMDRGRPAVVVPELKWRAIVWGLRHAPASLLGEIRRYRR